MRGRLRPGQRVLVHSGAGAVGLAAIAICLRRGCQVRLPARSRPAPHTLRSAHDHPLTVF